MPPSELLTGGGKRETGWKAKKIRKERCAILDIVSRGNLIAGSRIQPDVDRRPTARNQAVVDPCNPVTPLFPRPVFPTLIMRGHRIYARPLVHVALPVYARYECVLFHLSLFEELICEIYLMKLTPSSHLACNIKFNVSDVNVTLKETRRQAGFCHRHIYKERYTLKARTRLKKISNF